MMLRFCLAVAVEGDASEYPKASGVARPAASKWINRRSTEGEGVETEEMVRSKCIRETGRRDSEDDDDSVSGLLFPVAVLNVLDFAAARCSKAAISIVPSDLALDARGWEERWEEGWEG